jgi:GT2 family glycosyltransferase
MKWLESCLSSISKSSVKVNTIVIDNNSSDTTVAFIKQNYPEVLLFEQNDNLGFGRANNLGISYALENGCDYVFLLNQDAYLEENTLEKMIAIYKENLDFGILSPIHLNGEGTKLDRNFSRYLSYDKCDYFYFDAIKNKMKSIYSVSFVNAAAWLLPKKTLETIGGFDPLFFHYGEDDNYCQRVLFHKIKIAVVSNAFVKHDRELEQKRLKKTDEDRLKNEEIQLKVLWGNINMDTEKHITSYKRKMLKRIIKLVLQLKMKQVCFYIKCYNLAVTITPQIVISREVNKGRGKHYLKL